MANFDEDIKRITDEVLSDGTVEEIIREKIIKGFESAIDNAFRWGDLEKAIKERVKTVLVPFVESYNMDEYLVKMDTVLTELVKQSALVDNKRMLENFQFMMATSVEKEIKLSELFGEYEKFVARNMDTYGRDVSCETGEPEYVPMEIGFYFEKEEDRAWSSFGYSTVDFTVEEEEQQDKLNRTIRLSKYKNDKTEGWEISTDTKTDIYSLKNMDEFDLYLEKIQKANVRVIIDEEEDSEIVYSKDKPEPSFS